MKIFVFKFFCFIFFSTLFIHSVFASRDVEVADVEAVIFKGVKYTAMHHGIAHGKKQNGGYVQAWDIVSGAKLWEKQIYEIPDTFIAALHIKDDALYVYSEFGDVYVLLLSYPDDSLDTVLGHKTVIAGTALNLRDGAVVRKDLSFVYVKDLGSWPRHIEGNNIEISGVLNKRNLHPFEDERASARGDVAGYLYELEQTQWENILPPKLRNRTVINKALIND